MQSPGISETRTIPSLSLNSPCGRPNVQKNCPDNTRNFAMSNWYGLPGAAGRTTDALKKLLAVLSRFQINGHAFAK
jgi:hypothetical protein